MDRQVSAAQMGKIEYHNEVKTKQGASCRLEERKVTLTVHGCLATPKRAPATAPVGVAYSLLILK
jgi:hypothetical protein